MQFGYILLCRTNILQEKSAVFFFPGANFYTRKGRLAVAGNLAPVTGFMRLEHFSLLRVNDSDIR